MSVIACDTIIDCERFWGGAEFRWVFEADSDQTWVLRKLHTYLAFDLRLWRVTCSLQKGGVTTFEGHTRQWPWHDHGMT
jgi:hypothetical protein